MAESKPATIEKRTGYTIRVEPYFRLIGEATMFIDDNLTLEQAIRGAKRAEEIAGAAYV